MEKLINEEPGGVIEGNGEGGSGSSGQPSIRPGELSLHQVFTYSVSFVLARLCYGHISSLVAHITHTRRARYISWLFPPVYSPLRKLHLRAVSTSSSSPLHFPRYIFSRHTDAEDDVQPVACTPPTM